MLIAAFGLPGVMTAWGFAATRTIAREVLGEHRIVESDRLEDFARARDEVGPAHLLLLSQYPETALIEAVVSAHAQPILFLERMIGCAAYAAATSEQSPLAIVRAMSASAACLAPLRETSSVLAMRRESLGARRIDTLLAYLCHHLGLTMPEGTLSILARNLGQAPEAVGRAPMLEAAAARAIDGYVAPDASPAGGIDALATAILAPLDALFNFRTMPPIVWPGTSFLQGDRPDQPLADEVDLAGGARCLVYGPYLHMPAGDWSARVTLAFGPETRDQVFMIEAVAADVKARIRIAPEAPGRYAATITFTTTMPLVPVEIRVLMESGAIEGSLSLEGVQFTRMEAEKAA